MINRELILIFCILIFLVVYKGIILLSLSIGVSLLKLINIPRFTLCRESRSLPSYFPQFTIPQCAFSQPAV